ncbi:MAG: hypothetical protein HFG33_04900 [Bacilli bacterium]|nr:hypothetical protein [Bacilli bacterium]
MEELFKYISSTTDVLPYKNYRFYELFKELGILYLGDLLNEKMLERLERVLPTSQINEIKGFIAISRFVYFGQDLDTEFLDSTIKKDDPVPSNEFLKSLGFDKKQTLEMRYFLKSYQKKIATDLSLYDYFLAFIKSRKWLNLKTEMIVGFYTSNYERKKRDNKRESIKDDFILCTCFQPFYAYFKSLDIDYPEYLLDEEYFRVINKNCSKEQRAQIDNFRKLIIRRCQRDTSYISILNMTIIDFSNGDSNNLLEELGFNPIQKKLFMHYIMLYTATHHTRYVRLIDIFAHYKRSHYSFKNDLDTITEFYLKIYARDKEPNYEDEERKAIERQIYNLGKLKASLENQIDKLENKLRTKNTHSL